VIQWGANGDGSRLRADIDGGLRRETMKVLLPLPNGPHTVVLRLYDLSATASAQRGLLSGLLDEKRVEVLVTTAGSNGAVKASPAMCRGFAAPERSMCGSDGFQSQSAAARTQSAARRNDSLAAAAAAIPRPATPAPSREDSPPPPAAANGRGSSGGPARRFCVRRRLAEYLAAPRLHLHPHPYACAPEFSAAAAAAAGIDDDAVYAGTAAGDDPADPAAGVFDCTATPAAADEVDPAAGLLEHVPEAATLRRAARRAACAADGERAELVGELRRLGHPEDCGRALPAPFPGYAHEHANSERRRE
jgi:hypothetical protein